jgi:hypothetical protein
MSLAKWFSVATFIIIVVADIYGFITRASPDVLHTHADIGVAAALVGLVSMVLVLRIKR